MKPKYFILNKDTSLESLKKQYKALVLEHHADKLAGRDANNEAAIREKEAIMSEINVEYARLQEVFQHGGNNPKGIYRNLRMAQDELASIMKIIPDKAKMESRKKMENYLFDKWEKMFKPLLPEILQGVAELIIREKIKQFDFERELANFKPEEFIYQLKQLTKGK
jgi:hypothetical protein